MPLITKREGIIILHSIQQAIEQRYNPQPMKSYRRNDAYALSNLIESKDNDLESLKRFIEKYPKSLYKRLRGASNEFPYTLFKKI